MVHLTAKNPESLSELEQIARVASTTKLKPQDTYNFEIGYFTNKGRSILAGKNFKEGDTLTVVDYYGTLESELITLARDRITEGSLAQEVEKLMNDLIQVDNDLYLIPTPSIAFLINHSCSPNAALVQTVNGQSMAYEFKALRSIKSGEQICFDYSTVIGDDYILECEGSENGCRGFASRPLIMVDSEREKILVRYPVGWLLPYIQMELNEPFSVDKIDPEWVFKSFDGKYLKLFLERNPNLRREFKDFMLDYLAKVTKQNMFI